MATAKQMSAFVRCIWQWYGNHKRTLPWRDLDIADDTERAYRILVSEIMLQQTQVSRVKIVYRNFLEQFPDISSLAAASNGDVIKAWRGMGYNNRALRLRDSAKTVCEQHDGVFPVNMEALEALPGVGHYTAAAIRNFAFDIPTPCLDTNIRRIIHRAFYGPEKADGTWRVGDKALLKDAEELLNAALASPPSAFLFPLSTANWHAALMDFGSLVCTKRSPKWDICPLTKAGLMKAAHKVPKRNVNSRKREPGREVSGKHIPNRIFRGKIVEELRDEPSGLTSTEIGRRICLDWDEQEHMAWLEGIINALVKDHLVAAKQGRVKLVA